MARDYRRTSSTRPSKRHTKPAPASAPGGLKWTIIGILVGLLGAIAIFWEYTPHLMQGTTPFKRESAQTHHHHSAVQKENSTADAKAAQSHAPQFDFYTLLPKTQVNSSNNPPTPAPQIPATKKTAPAAPPPIRTAPADTSRPVNAPAVSAPPGIPAVAATSNPSAAAPPSVSAKPANAPEESAKHAGKYGLQVASVKNYSDADRLKAQLSMLGFNVTIQKYTVDGQVWNRVFAGPFPSKQAAVEKQQMLRENNISSMVVKQQ